MTHIRKQKHHTIDAHHQNGTCLDLIVNSRFLLYRKDGIKVS